MSAPYPRTVPQPWSLAGKTAVVTGASRGIGQAIAIYLVQKGVSKLAITYASSADGAEETLKEARKLGVKEAVALKLDLFDTEVGPHLVAAVQAKLKVTEVDIIVNNAVSTAFEIMTPVASTDWDNFSKMFQNVAFAPLSIASAFLPLLPSYGGRVISISSVASKIANDDPAAIYGSAKAALDSLTRSLAKQFGASKGATFNTVSVGPTSTDTMHKVGDIMGQEFLDKLTATVTVGKRPGMPQEIAYIVGFLASDEGRWVNGANVSANGGMTDVLSVQG